jgi:hypothetical protein
MKKFIIKNRLTPQSQPLPENEPTLDQKSRSAWGRRSFLKGLGATGAILLPASALLMSKAKAQETTDQNDNGGKLTRGDAAILRFLATAEILESDLWEQYWELGGTQDKDFASARQLIPTGGNPFYTSALQILDEDMDQYILDNTDDEFSHAKFLRAYMASKGASTAEIDLLNGPHFRTLPGSTATGPPERDGLPTSPNSP